MLIAPHTCRSQQSDLAGLVGIVHSIYQCARLASASVAVNELSTLWLLQLQFQMSEFDTCWSQVAVRLLEFATVRALEVQAAVASTEANVSGSGAHTGAKAITDTAATAAARAVLAGESRQPCKLRMRVAQVKADLIRQREIQLLLPAAGPGASEVLRLLRPATETGMSIAVPATADVPLSASSAALTTFNAGESVSTNVQASNGEATSTATASELVGMSCTIGSSGEVCGNPA